MKNNNTLTITALVLLISALCSCSGAKEQMGLAKKSPDEFAVTKRAPLAMPPDYGLRPPEPGAPRPQEQATSEQAREAVFGAQEPSSGGTGDESLSPLLVHAGAGHADPNIRQEVDAETAELGKKNIPVAKKIFGLGGKPEDAPASVVDAKEEAERLKKNEEEGKPATTGDTPSVTK